MFRTRLSAGFLSIFLAGLLASRAGADPVADLAKSSVFKQVDLGALSGGKIFTGGPPALGGPRDLAVQAVYLIHVPLARAVDLHKNWDAARHSELKIFIHHDLPAHPALADFTAAIPDNSAIRKLADATEKFPNIGDIQISRAEAAAYKPSGSGSFPPGVRDFWSQLLYKRTASFLAQGLAGQPAYDTGDGPVRPGDELSRLLREEPAVRAAFHPVIDRSPLGGGAGSLPLAPYWELINEEGVGTFTLGAACSTQSADSAQLLDLQYYASGAFYAYATLYQMWPVTVDGKAATLVWRVDSISTQSVADLGPFDRMGSRAAMMKEIQRIVGLFQKDVGQ